MSSKRNLFGLSSVASAVIGVLTPISAQGLQTPAYRYDFDETAGAGTTVLNQGSAGTGDGALIMTNGSANTTNGTAPVATNLYGSAGSGKSGGAADYALDCTSALFGTTNGALNAGVYSETTLTTGSTGTITTLGTLPVYSLSFWMLPTQSALGYTAASEPRVMFLGAATGQDIGTANTLYIAYDKPNLVWGVSGTTNVSSTYQIADGSAGTGNQVDPGWDFYAITYDGAHLDLYEGDSSTSATLKQTVADTGGTLALDGAAWLDINNRQGGSRAFAAKYDDIQIFTSALSSADVVNAQNDITAPIPEPATLGLLGVGSLMMLHRRRRRA
jgi:hypothetical protein